MPTIDTADLELSATQLQDKYPNGHPVYTLHSWSNSPSKLSYWDWLELNLRQIALADPEEVL